MDKENSKEIVIKDKNILREEYWNYLSDQEKKAFIIAKNHLGTSFNIEKSNGFNEWLKNK